MLSTLHNFGDRTNTFNVTEEYNFDITSCFVFHTWIFHLEFSYHFNKYYFLQKCSMLIIFTKFVWWCQPDYFYRNAINSFKLTWKGNFRSRNYYVILLLTTIYFLKMRLKLSRYLWYILFLVLFTDAVSSSDYMASKLRCKYATVKWNVSFSHWCNKPHLLNPGIEVCFRINK